jgi:acetyl esterase/lipase
MRSRWRVTLAIPILVGLAAATLAGQGPSSSMRAAAEPERGGDAAAAEQPAVKPGGYRRLGPVRLYPGPAPIRSDWPGRLAGAPTEASGANGEAVFNVTEPLYTPFLPEDGNSGGTAVLIAPGGAFRQLSINSEGTRVAIWLAERGVAAFVLKYRLVQQAGPPFSMMARMQEIPMSVAGEPAVADGLRAIALIRQNATHYRIDPARVVAIGFSAGAHVVTHAALAADPAVRPNYVAAIYGAPFDGIPPIPDAGAADSLPPMFLAMAQDDTLVGEDVREFYAQLFAKGYRPELHLYMSGNHGFGMNARHSTSDLFIDQFLAWMRAQGLTRRPGDGAARPGGRAAPGTAPAPPARGRGRGR